MTVWPGRATIQMSHRRLSRHRAAPHARAADSGALSWAVFNRGRTRLRGAQRLGVRRLGSVLCTTKRRVTATKPMSRRRLSRHR
jgi:hypothetical protein